MSRQYTDIDMFFCKQILMRNELKLYYLIQSALFVFHFLQTKRPSLDNSCQVKLLVQKQLTVSEYNSIHYTYLEQNYLYFRRKKHAKHFRQQRISLNQTVRIDALTRGLWPRFAILGDCDLDL